MKILRNLILLCFLLFVDAVYGQLPNTGLFFYSHQNNIDKRTSLTLNDNEPYSLHSQDVFSLEFDILMRNENTKFGYFCRIISNKNENFDLMVNYLNGKFFVLNNQDFPLSDEPVAGNWNHASITFDKKQNKISIQSNEQKLNCDYDLSNTKNLSVYFGLCDHKGFAGNDAAPIILKDVIVKYNGKDFHHWMLGKHAQNAVYDELKKRKAIVHNPYWLMDNSVHWQKRAEFKTDAFTQITFDSIQNQIFILNPKGYNCFHVDSDIIDTVTIAGNVPHNSFYNRLLFNHISQQLVYYGFDSDRTYFYNFKDKVWTGYQNHNEEPTHAHHNRYISALDSILYLFGGYGFYQYKSDFFRINLKTNKLNLFDLSHTITPRYLAAMGGNTTGDKLYIFGGRGAEMGRQELSPKNFSDLFEINLKTLKTRHLFDLDKKYEENNVYSNSLIVDEKNGCFYVLAYPHNKYSSNITLKRINFTTREMETLADTIPFYFEDVTSFCDLFYSPRLSKLIAVTSYSDENKTSNVSIYTLDYPPLRENDVIQIASKAINWAWFLIPVLIAGAIFVLLLIKKKTGSKKETEFVPSKEKTQNIEPGNQETEKSFYDIQKQSILFLGGFQVFNKEGNNITGEFTPTLKFLLVLIILYTLKNKKGISSAKLQEFLWFDKSEEAARNNRSVNMRKLRVLLQTVGDIEINNENGYWTISINPSVFSDYWEALKLIEKIQSGNDNMSDDMLHLLELLSYGPMLPNIQFEWVDSFKNDFANAVIDVLLNFFNNSNNSHVNNLDLRVKIADTILKIDPISEEAIAIKCNALFKIGKKGLAKTTFDNFTKEYKSLLGETYNGSLKSILN